jgi:hypothetical protein
MYIQVHQYLKKMDTYNKKVIFLLNYTLTHSAQHSPSWEAKRFAANQEIPRIFMKPEGSLPHSQVPANYLYSEPAQSSPYPKITLPEGLS